MDFLATVIGNAVADPAFRTRLLDDPRGAIDEWGFRLSKGEMRMLDEMLTEDKKEKLAQAFDNLEEQLLEAVPKIVLCPQKQCPGFGCYPPMSQESLRKKLDELKFVA